MPARATVIQKIQAYSIVVSGFSCENVATAEESELATAKSEERNKKQASKIQPQAEWSFCLLDSPS